MPSFAVRGTSFLEGHQFVEAAPTSGSTIVLQGGSDLLITNVATTAALTLQLPGGVKGDVLEVKAIAAVTALTWKTPTGATTTANGVPASLTAGQKVVLRYTSLGWQLW